MIPTVLFTQDFLISGLVGVHTGKQNKAYQAIIFPESKHVKKKEKLLS